MPIKQAAWKALRQTKKRTARRKAVKDNVEYLAKMFRKAAEKKDKSVAEDFLKKAIKSIDRAWSNNVLKRNTAARLKSRLSSHYHKVFSVK